MKIEKVEVVIQEHEFMPQVFVNITDSDGLKGIGEAWWGLATQPVIAAIEHTLAPQILGEDSRKIEYLWQKMYKYSYRYGTEGILLCGLSGIDLALWDMLGKRLNVPVAQLMGGTVRDSLKAYASLPPLRDPNRLKMMVKKSIDDGYAGVKLHEYSLDLIALARETAGETYPIMVDVNGHWTALEAEKSALDMEEYNIDWFEEPLWPMQDHEAMSRLRQKTNVNLAAGENEYSLKGFASLMKSGHVTYIQPEITKIGGLTMARKVSALADLYNLPICPHGFRVGPALYANTHWALAELNMEWLEVPLLPDEISFATDIPVPEMEDGCLLLPEGPGLGLP